MSVISVSRRPASTAQEQNQEEIPSSAIDREPFRKPVPLGASATQHFFQITIAAFPRPVDSRKTCSQNCPVKVPQLLHPCRLTTLGMGGGIPGSRLDGGVED